VRAKPVNLNFFTIAFPITAIASILHRISGLILFMLIPYVLGLLQNTLIVPVKFSHTPHVQEMSLYTKVVIWFAISALVYHMLAGLRHIIMDAGFGEEKRTARITAFVVIKATLIISLILGINLLC
jgi:succinate dehydrogenase / fumarate reductase cytochrome b subunit